MIKELIQQRTVISTQINGMINAFLKALHNQGHHAPSVTPLRGHCDETIEDISVDGEKISITYKSGCNCCGYDTLYLDVPIKYIENPSQEMIAEYIVGVNKVKEEQNKVAQEKQAETKRKSDLAELARLQALYPKVTDNSNP